MGRAVGYEPRFDRDLERGNVGEDLLELFFADGENNNMFEVKTDYRINETGNIYVETHKYRNPDQSDLVPSGINVTEAKWWVQASPEGTAMAIFKTDQIRKYIELVNPPKSAQPISNNHSAASLGVLIPMRGLMKFCKMWKAND
jgi:cellulose biosynthesis protein BcsQ